MGVDHDRAGIASGLINTSQQVGGALGVAILSTVTFTEVNSYLAAHATGPPSQLLASQALVSGFHYAFLTGAALAMIGLVASITMIPGGTPDEILVADGLPEPVES
jgi:hypothetical protein